MGRLPDTDSYEIAAACCELFVVLSAVLFATSWLVLSSALSAKYHGAQQQLQHVVPLVRHYALQFLEASLEQVLAAYSAYADEHVHQLTAGVNDALALIMNLATGLLTTFNDPSIEKALEDFKVYYLHDEYLREKRDEILEVLHTVKDMMKTDEIHTNLFKEPLYRLVYLTAHKYVSQWPLVAHIALQLFHPWTVAFTTLFVVSVSLYFVMHSVSFWLGEETSSCHIWLIRVLSIVLFALSVTMFTVASKINQLKPIDEYIDQFIVHLQTENGDSSKPIESGAGKFQLLVDLVFDRLVRFVTRLSVESPQAPYYYVNREKDRETLKKYMLTGLQILDMKDGMYDTSTPVIPINWRNSGVRFDTAVIGDVFSSRLPAKSQWEPLIEQLTTLVCRQNAFITLFANLQNDPHTFVPALLQKNNLKQLVSVAEPVI